MKIKYNWDYDRYVTEDGNVFRYDYKQDKLILCKPNKSKNGYCRIKYNGKNFQTHRVIFETFVGEIPEGYEIDHINTIRDDNRLENLRCVTHAENNRNGITRQHRSDTRIKNSTSDFGKKYFEHFGYSRAKNIKQYSRELQWYYNHNKTCSWEYDK